MKKFPISSAFSPHDALYKLRHEFFNNQLIIAKQEFVDFLETGTNYFRT